MSDQEEVEPKLEAVSNEDEGDIDEKAEVNELQGLPDP